MTHYDVPLLSYTDYDPCQFRLWDVFYGTRNAIVSGAFGINVTNQGSGSVWSVEQPGPVGDVRSSLQASSGRRGSAAGGLVGVILCVGGLAATVALGM